VTTGTTLHDGENDAAPRPRAIRTKHGRIFRWARTYACVLALVVGVRALLPIVLRAYVNRVLDGTEGYVGRIGDVDIDLWRGAYDVERIELVKPGSDADDPFLRVQRLDVEVEWPALLRGSVVAEATLHHPIVTFVSARSGEDSQTGEESSWAERLDALLPFRLERFVIRDGEVRFVAETTEPPVDLYMTDFYLEALNLSNIRDKETDEVLLAQVEAAGRPFGTGEFEARLRLDPLADPARFELDASLARIQLIDLNDFLRAYGSVDAESGTFEMYSEFAASDGYVEGYVKTLFEEVQLLSFREIDGPEDALEAFWEGLLAIGSELFENQPRDRLATRVPLRGRLDDVRTAPLAVLGNLLRNAFVAALRPAIDESIELKDLEIVVPEAGAKGRDAPDGDEDDGKVDG
jgi:hypothetical protein